MASSFRKDLLFRFMGDPKSLQQASRAAQRSLGGVEQVSSKASSAIRGIRRAALVVGPALAAREIVQGVRLAEALDSQYQTTAKIIEDTGGAAQVTAEHVKTMAREMALATGIPKETVLKAQNILLTFKEIRNTVGDGNQVFDRATKLTADMAAVFGGSASDAAKQLGKALNDPITGLGALSRVGVQFTDQQKDQIRTLVETGRTLEAQKIILDEIESQVGGTAEASADATAQIARAWDEVQEAIGNAVLPFIQEQAPKFIAAVNAIEDGTAGINFELGRLELDKAANQLDFFGRITGKYTDGLEDLQRAQQTGLLVARDYIRAIKDGVSPTGALANAVATLTVNSQLNETALGELQTRVGLTDAQMKLAVDRALIYADAFGFTTDQIAELNALTATYTDTLSVQETAAAQATDRADALEAAWKRDQEAAADASEATDDLTRSTKDLADEMKALTDPVFRAERATDAYTRALADARADGKLTQDEIETVTEKFVDMQAAVAAIDAENVEAFKDAAVEALGLTRTEADKAAGALSSLGQVDTSPGFRAMQDLVSRLETLSGRPITIDFSNIRFATDAEIEQAVSRAILSMQRRGTIKPVML